MAKVTSKLQVTIPKKLAEELGIAPGDEIDWSAAGEGIRLEPVRQPLPASEQEDRMRLFEQATARQRQRERERPLARVTERGWSREELYERGRPR